LNQPARFRRCPELAFADLNPIPELNGDRHAVRAAELLPLTRLISVRPVSRNRESTQKVKAVFSATFNRRALLSDRFADSGIPA
jgi:hypothetical protein